MADLKKFFPSILLVFVALSCGRLTKENFHLLSEDERRSLSAEYTQLAKRLETGSPKNMMILEKAIRINPQNDLAWRELSLPYLHAGMYSKWSENIEKAIALNPEAWQAWRGYDRLFYFRDYAGALFDFDASDTLTRNQIDYPQNTSVDYLRGLCYYGLRDYQKAEEYFSRFIEDEKIKVGDPYIDESAFLYLGLIAIEQNRLADAEMQFLRGLKYEDSFADFNFHLAKLYCILDDPEEAEKQYKMAKKKFDNGNHLRGYRYEEIAQLYISDFEELEEQINYSLANRAVENSMGTTG